MYIFSSRKELVFRNKRTYFLAIKIPLNQTHYTSFSCCWVGWSSSTELLTFNVIQTVVLVGILNLSRRKLRECHKRLLQSPSLSPLVIFCLPHWRYSTYGLEKNVVNQPKSASLAGLVPRLSKFTSEKIAYWLYRFFQLPISKCLSQNIQRLGIVLPYFVKPFSI
jgi:hypothetical protein